MDTEMFNLTWEDFQQSAKETFRSLVDEEDFMDVTLVCEDDKQLRAHKVILSACSKFFKNILMRNPHQNPLLFISGINFRDLKAILNFMYLGETMVEQSHLDSFMAACSILKVKGLTTEQEPQMNIFPAEKDEAILHKTSENPLNKPHTMIKTEKVTTISDD